MNSGRIFLTLAASCVALATLGPGATLFAQAAPSDAVEATVKGALQQYSAALESLDAAAVKKIQPSIDVERLKRAFRDMKALEVEIDTIKVLTSEPEAARVSCRVTQVLTPKAGSKRTTTVTRVMRLRRQDAAWVIDGFER